MATLAGFDEEALKLFEEAMEALKDADKGNKLLRQTRLDLAFVLHRLDRFEEAAPLFLEALPDIPIVHGALPEEHMTYQLGAVIALIGAARWAEAEAPARDLVGLELKHRPRGHLQRELSHLFLGSILVHLGRFAEAEPILSDVVPNLPESVWIHHWAKNLLGGSFAGQGRYDEAEPLLLTGYEKMNPSEGALRHKRESLERVVRLYDAWGKPDKAAEWRLKGETK